MLTLGEARKGKGKENLGAFANVVCSDPFFLNAFALFRVIGFALFLRFEFGLLSFLPWKS